MVQFYDHEVDLVRTVGQYLVTTASAGDAAVVVATEAHRLAFEAEMSRAGVDVDDARRRGTYVPLDAVDTLSQFCQDGQVDAEAFASVIGGVISAASETGRSVRAYGEMVALLWDAGHVMAAIELEALWNDLGSQLPFSLFCAYPSEAVAGPHHSSSFRQVCHLHTAVVPAPAPFPAVGRRWDKAEASLHLAPKPEAAKVARRFVAETLAGWGLEDLTDDAALIVTELVTNSVLHARSALVVSLSKGVAGVRIEVRDTDPTAPVRRADASLTQSGRGLDMVIALARRWGSDVVADGKVVWAELAR